MEKIKVTYVDNNDTYYGNVFIGLSRAGADVTAYTSGCCIEQVIESNPDGIMLGPGPGTPSEAGNYMKILRDLHKNYPIDGICLGHQAIVEFFSKKKTQKLNRIVHGGSVPIEHNGKGIFEGIKSPYDFIRYNSLGFYEDESFPDCLEITARQIGVEPEKNIIMAVEHKEYPIKSVQFHPDSNFSGDGGQKIFDNLVKEIRLYKEMNK